MNVIQHMEQNDASLLCLGHNSVYNIVGTVGNIPIQRSHIIHCNGGVTGAASALARSSSTTPVGGRNSMTGQPLYGLCNNLVGLDDILPQLFRR